ncbi:MAG TPA: hypothetical protein DDZ88_14575 [Verrucomicrobiales bacterium]|nr:hypothetical protein [Verrucomicrobiales bacterium]
MFALVQCLFLWIGLALARKGLRIMEQSELWRRHIITEHVPSCASFVLSVGFWAFSIPLLWTAWVTVRSETANGIVSARPLDTWITMGLTLVIVCVWSYAAMQMIGLAFGFRGPLKPW